MVAVLSILIAIDHRGFRETARVLSDKPANLIPTGGENQFLRILWPLYVQHDTPKLSHTLNR